jgi:hypothetical protein
MKIDWKLKQTKVVAGILAVILVPIIWNQGKTLITGAVMFDVPIPPTRSSICLMEYLW